MFWNILRMESAKVFNRRLIWVGLIITLIPVIIAFLAFFNLGHSASSIRYWVWAGGLTSSLAFADGYSPGYGYAVYLLAVVIGLVTAQEYSWRTMQLWLSHGLLRSLLLLAKFVLAVIAALVITLIFLLAGGVLSLILNTLPHVNAATNLNVLALLISVLRTCYGMLPYIALTFLLVVVSRSAAVSIGGLILFMLAIELPLTVLLPLLGKNYAVIAQFLPAGLAQTMNQQNYTAVHLALPTFISAGQTDPGIAAICIAVYTIILFGLALRIFQRQNMAS